MNTEYSTAELCEAQGMSAYSRHLYQSPGWGASAVPSPVVSPASHSENLMLDVISS